MKKHIESVRNCGSSLTYPKGCFEVVIEFSEPQSHPNINLPDHGEIITYQGLQNVRLPGMHTYTGVVGYYNGQPHCTVGQTC